MVLMRSHNICFCREIRKIILELSFKERNVPTGDNPIEKGGKNENGTVASPESIPIHLKVYGFTSIFFCHVFKGRQYSGLPVLLTWRTKFPNWGRLLKERICSNGRKFFSL